MKTSPPNHLQDGSLSHPSGRPSLITTIFVSKRPLQFVFCLLCVFFLCAGLAPWNATAAQDRAPSEVVRPAVQAPLAAKLTADFRSAMTDKPLRDALQSVADTVGFNLWLDRGVDPGQLVSSDPSCSTPYQIMVSLARSARLDVFVIDNMVLVGRPQVLFALTEQLGKHSSNAVVVDVQWPELTTPTEAWTSIAGSSARELPYDLWPAVSWKQVDSVAAQSLVLGQFQETRSVAVQVPQRPSRSATQISKWMSRYPLGDHAKALRQQVQAQDPTVTIREADGMLLVTTTAAAHQAAVDAWLGQPANKSPALDIDAVKFSLNLQRTPAAKVFQQLAATSGRRLQMTPEAQQACQRLIDLAAVDLSLRELSKRVAAVAGVTIQWTDQELRVSSRP